MLEYPPHKKQGLKMTVFDRTRPQLGLGCWPIGGAMYAADGTSLGYTGVDDKTSINAIHAAVANGIKLFDTAAAYGAGHSETLLAEALQRRDDVFIVTKIGLEIKENERVIVGEELESSSVIPAIDRCLARLKREQIDCVLLHPNRVDLDVASDIFDQMEVAVTQGKVRSFGWSTDYVDHVQAFHDRPGFKVIEHAMHVLMDAPSMRQILQDKPLDVLIRSPLAMGLLSGKYTVDTVMPQDDVRSTQQSWTRNYIDGKPNPEHMIRFDAIRELLKTGGRTEVQGALGWLWGKSENNIPVPGARTVEQVEGLAGALAFGALPESTIEEIDSLVGDLYNCDGASPR